MQELKKKGSTPGKARIPPVLDAAKLFRLDVDDDIWNDDGLWDDEDSPVPMWLGDEGVRVSIPALLEKDRILEELERLDVEESNLVSWLHARADDIRKAFLRHQSEFRTKKLLPAK